MDSKTYMGLKDKAFNQVFDEIKRQVDAGRNPCSADVLWRPTADAQAEINGIVGNVVLSVLSDPASAKQYPGIREWLMLSVKDLQESLACEDLHVEQARDNDFKNLQEAA